MAEDELAELPTFLTLKPLQGKGTRQPSESTQKRAKQYDSVSSWAKSPLEYTDNSHIDEPEDYDEAKVFETKKPRSNRAGKRERTEDIYCHSKPNSPPERGSYRKQPRGSTQVASPQRQQSL